MKKGWVWSTIGDCCQLTSGGTPSKRNARFWVGDVPFVSARDLKSDCIDTASLHISREAVEQSATKVAPVGSLLMLVRGMGLANGIQVGEVTAPVAFNQDIRAIHPPRASMVPRFLLLALKSSFLDGQGERALSSAAHGTLKIDTEALRQIRIPLPPLPEQRRIVGILDEAFAGIATAKANAEKNLHNARAVFESHLNAVFTRRGKGWADRQLATLCQEITVGHVGPMKTQYKEGGIPFLRSQNIRPFEISMENAMFIDEAFHRALKKSQLRPGDLAIVRTGYPGTAAVIPPELHDSNCSDLVIVRPSREVCPHFLAAFFNSAFGKQLVLGKIVGAAQKHFNITAAKEVMLHVPPMPEQLAIVVKSNELREETERLATLYERKLAALAALKQSLLHRAFSGEL